MIDYPAGSLKRHPDWPGEKVLAMRTVYEDGQYAGWTSWIRITPNRTEFIAPEDVADWPDVSITDAP